MLRELHDAMLKPHGGKPPLIDQMQELGPPCWMSRSAPDPRRAPADADQRRRAAARAGELGHARDGLAGQRAGCDFRRRSGSPGALAMIGFLTRPRWSAVDWSPLALLAMVTLPQFALPAVGRWEGLIAPAAGDFASRGSRGRPSRDPDLGRFRAPAPGLPIPGGRVVADGNGTSVPVIVEHLRGSIARAPGLNRFGPWRLSIPPDQLHLSRAVVYHKCPWRPWLTETHLYP